MVLNSLENNIKIVNVVVSTKLDNVMDLVKLARSLPRTIYEPEIFSGLVHRKKFPKSTIILFGSGTITSIGTINEEDGRNSIFSTIVDIEKIINKQVKPTTFSTVNVVAVMSLDETYDLNKFHLQSIISKYDSKKFAGLILSLRNGKCLIFSTGKIISVGTKSEKMAKENIFEARKLLTKFHCIQKI